MSAIWSGTTMSPTTSTNSRYRPRNSIHEKAYAANAASVMGMTVDGTATARLLRKALPNPSVDSAER